MSDIQELDPAQSVSQNNPLISSPVYLRLIRYILSTAAVLAIILAALHKGYRDDENNLTGLVLVPMSIGLGGLLLSWAIGSPWERVVFWLAIALVGEAVSLQLINAGWQLRYQHYKPISDIVRTESGVIFLLFLLAQTILVGVAIKPFLAPIASWCERNLNRWQMVLLVVAFVVPTTTVSRDISAYLEEWAFAVFIQIISLGAILLAVLKMPERLLSRIRLAQSRMFGDLHSSCNPEPGSPDRFVLSLAAFVIVLTSSICIFSYELHPHVTDEATYLIQARILATGAVTVPAPPVPEGFETFLMDVKEGRSIPVPPPGWPLILSLGVLLGVPWLVNPFLAGLNLVLAYVLLREWYSRSFARVSVFLIALSPWYIFLGMSLMTHMFSLTCALLGAAGVARSKRGGRATWALFGGSALGMLSMVRPLEAVAMAGLLGIWVIGFGAKRVRLPIATSLFAGTLIIGGIGLAYNAALTGNPLEFPINSYTDRLFGKNSNAFGFGPDRGMGWELDPYPGHGPIDALVNTNLNVSALNTELFGWSIGSFLLIAIGLCLGRLDTRDYWMLAVIGVIYALHFFYYFSGGPDFGARYWFLMLVPLAALAGRGLVKLVAKLDDQFQTGSIRALSAILACCTITILVFVPWRAIDKYHNFRGMRPDVRYLAKAHNFGPSLVLVQGDKDPDYASAAVYNPLDLMANTTIYAWDRDKDTRTRLLEAYADRPVWTIRGPSLTGRGYEVIEGPVAARELLKRVEK